MAHDAEWSTMTRLDDWTTALCADLGLDLAEDAQKTILDMARIVAHTIDRPAAPVTAFYLGIAVGRGQSLSEAAAQAQQLAADFPPAAD
jgi:Domain of unknown function (DUF6457)